MTVKKAFLSVVCLLLSTCVASAQFKIIGPTKEEAGNLIVITLTEFKGEDIVIDCFPKNTYWTANKNLKGEPQVSFATNKQDVYTFVFATNKDKVTYMLTHAVTVGNPQPRPPTPNPNPTPSDPLVKRFDAVYMVSPNSAQLVNYIAVFEALDKQNDGNAFTAYKQAWDVLVSSTKDKLKSDTDLRALRDEVATYLVENTGRDSTKYDKAKLSSALKNLIAALKAVQTNRP